MSHVTQAIILQVHMVQRGAIEPLIKLIQSQDVKLQEFSAFVLGKLAQVINHNQIIFLCLLYILFGGEEQSFVTSLLSLMLVCL